MPHNHQEHHCPYYIRGVWIVCFIAYVCTYVGVQVKAMVRGASPHGSELMDLLSFLLFARQNCTKLTDFTLPLSDDAALQPAGTEDYLQASRPNTPEMTVSCSFEIWWNMTSCLTSLQYRKGG
jgi:hypothetical protein